MFLRVKGDNTLDILTNKILVSLVAFLSQHYYIEIDIICFFLHLTVQNASRVLCSIHIPLPLLNVFGNSYTTIPIQFQLDAPLDMI